MFLALNCILGVAFLARLVGGPFLLLVEAEADLDRFCVVLRGDLRAVFFAGMVRLLSIF